MPRTEQILLESNCRIYGDKLCWHAHQDISLRAITAAGDEVKLQAYSNHRIGSRRFACTPEIVLNISLRAITAAGDEVKLQAYCNHRIGSRRRFACTPEIVLNSPELTACFE
jgi:hypothetical protein